MRAFGAVVSCGLCLVGCLPTHFEPLDGGAVTGSGGGGAQSGSGGGGAIDAGRTDAGSTRDGGRDAGGVNPECLGSDCLDGGSDAGRASSQCSGASCWVGGTPPDAGTNCTAGAVQCAFSPFSGYVVMTCSGGLWAAGRACDQGEPCASASCATLDAGAGCSQSCHHGDPACEQQRCEDAGICSNGRCQAQGCVLGPSLCLDHPPALHLDTSACGDTSTSVSMHATGCEIESNTDFAPDQDWSFTAPASGTYSVTVTPSSAWDAVVSVRGASCGVTTCLAASNTGGAGQSETLSFKASAGATYFVIVDGNGSAAGRYTVLVH